MQHKTSFFVGLFIVCASFSQGAFALTLDNDAGLYSLPPLPGAASEAERLNRNEQDDQVPVGRHVAPGDSITIVTGPLADGAQLTLVAGFRDMWHGGPGQLEILLTEGTTTYRIGTAGPLFLRHTGPADGPKVDVSITGGSVHPLWVQGVTTATAWQAEVASYGTAPWTQFIGDRAMITLPYDPRTIAEVTDPDATFAMLDQVLTLSDDLSCLGCDDRFDAPSLLRQHYLVDLDTRPDDGYYMYATDGFIGMRPENTGDLTNPATLSREWAIWHETGHIHQPRTWTWDSLTEINTNLWSLYVQEAMGQPSRLSQDDGSGKSPLAQARDYLAAGAPDYLADDYDTLFIRLVMFHQLRRAYGWELFANLNRTARADPLPWDATTQDKADWMVVKLCVIVGHDLRPFFARWGLIVSPAASARLDEMGFSLPPKDPSRDFGG